MTAQDRTDLKTATDLLQQSYDAGSGLTFETFLRVEIGEFLKEAAMDQAGESPATVTEPTAGEGVSEEELCKIEKRLADLQWTSHSPISATSARLIAEVRRLRARVTELKRERDEARDRSASDAALVETWRAEVASHRAALEEAREGLREYTHGGLAGFRANAALAELVVAGVNKSENGRGNGTVKPGDDLADTGCPKPSCTTPAPTTRENCNCKMLRQLLVRAIEQEDAWFADVQRALADIDAARGATNP